LINEGNIGLIKAAKKFDPSRGTKFISYACWWVNSSIKNAISRQRGVISMPFSHFYILHKIKRKHEELVGNNVNEPSMEDLADSLGLSVDCIEKHMQAPDSCLSLDVLVSDDSHQSFKDFLAEDDPVSIDRNIERRDSNELIKKLLDKIEPRQKKVINMRFGLDGKECLTLREAAKRLNLSYERIRQIQEDSLRSLRDISAEYF
jgi:RNA polymerase primary sigma factor